uniref:Pentacotripeptide-repeat region of PRORP domain-containing protein n=1 Tax=Trypanosoma vivax (strain Y486) TaxID=1055687 RepID=G0U473_TRYVY|nr:conserved hypothetical protein [Trypanosoma vivax Y486]
MVNVGLPQLTSALYNSCVFYVKKPRLIKSNHSKLKAVGRLEARETVGGMDCVTAHAVTEGKTSLPSIVSTTSDSYSSRSAYNCSVAGIASKQAYMYRVRHGLFDDLESLASAPYAASPLRILADVLCEAMKQRVLIVEELVGDSQTDGKSVGNEMLTRFGQMVNSLSDALAIRSLLGRAVDILKEATGAVVVVGDRFSEEELQRELSDVELLMGQLRCWEELPVTNANIPSVSDQKLRRLLEWNLPSTVKVEILHALLDVCKLTGAYTLATELLDGLIKLSEIRKQLFDRRSPCDVRSEECRQLDEQVQFSSVQNELSNATFALDDVVQIAEEEARQIFRPVAAADHVSAIHSCVLRRKFDIAHALFQRFIQHSKCGVFPITAGDLTNALVGLAHSCNNSAHFSMLHELFVKSEVASAVPVSVELYTALIDAVSRAPEYPQQMSFALALYRRLRDGDLTPTSETYAALMACCASACEPTSAFAFYHESLQQCGAGSMTPTSYTNLILAYARAGYGADARTTLEVLVEAGAPLNRSAFHAALACAVTLRDAEEILQLMVSKYSIGPTPQTYAYLVRAAGANPAGVSTVLHLFDWHELVLRGTLENGSYSAETLPQGLLGECNEKRTALCTAHPASLLEQEVFTRYPMYNEAMEWALLQLRIDPSADQRLLPYIRPLLRVAQLRMNSFTEMAPQVPTVVPKQAAIAVLAADVLANVDELFVPFISHYSAVVIPYSAIVAMRRGGGWRVDGSGKKSPSYLLGDSLYRELGSEREVMLTARRTALARFLRKYSEVVHLVSLSEELMLSLDCDRYGIGIKQMVSRSAALALNLSRMDVPNATRVYAEHQCDIVLVSTDFERCGRFIVDIKKELLRRNKAQHRDTVKHAGLIDGLQRVWYHNPRTSPHWRQPEISMASLVAAA